MDLKKYKHLLLNNIKKQIIAWFESDNEANIPNEEVYRFLHSIKGTSGTLELEGLYQLSSELIIEVKEEEDRHWLVTELREYLYPLIQLSYHYEHFEEEADIEPTNAWLERAPLIHIIGDDVSMLIILKDALEKQGWMVLTNTDPEKATNQYFDLLPDCLVIDLDMSMKNGFELLEDIHEHNKRQFVPKVILSVNSNREERIAAFKTGADDFMKKQIDIEEFIVRINRHLQRKQLFDQSVSIDELTQVYNRKQLQDVYQRQADQFVVKQQPFSIVMLDIDHFKQVNDTYGHSVGDKVLYDFAQFLVKNVKKADTVFRYGGEEFIILFAGISYQEVQEKIQGMIDDYATVKHRANESYFSLTFSGGVYTVQDQATDLSVALEQADQALYKAKENGRARVEIGNDTLQEVSKKKIYVSVIDDDGIIRTILTKILNNIKLVRVELDIEVFENGAAFFEKKRPEVKGKHFIILDGVMPVMDGIEVLQKLKSQKHAANFNIMMLTSRKSENDIVRALALGADDYLTKPFSINELQARIQRLLQRIE
ncbi:MULTISPECIES: diguanylate cyclase [Paraliobacillus]|uniref:diguanylate cyclase n=1 Tax=Paraliobacillus TaxID=200903 RepID=UPI000DD37418|nr:MULTISPECIES: diguanylate cyclase [Paraliobacillus]